MATPKKTKDSKSNKKFNFIDNLYEEIINKIQVNAKGKVEFKKADLKKILETVFTEASKEAVKGNKVKFPVIGMLSMKEIPPRKAGKQKNPFTGEIVDVPARPASRKPKWSFTKSLRVFFADKKNWK